MYSKIVKTLTEAQKRALLLFGKTDNFYRYRDELNRYEEPFLWSDSKFTIESAPDSTLWALGNKDLLRNDHSKYTGFFWFLSPLGEKVLLYMQDREEQAESNRVFIADMKEVIRKAREEK